MTKLFSLIGMAATLVIAYGVDWGLKSLAETAQRTFVYEPYLWLAGPANLVLAGALGRSHGLRFFGRREARWYPQFS